MTRQHIRNQEKGDARIEQLRLHTSSTAASQEHESRPGRYVGDIGAQAIHQRLAYIPYTKPTGSTGSTPLRALATCGHCGKPLTGSWSHGKRQRYAYYHCPPKARCRKTNLRRHDLEAQFVSLLERLRPRPELVSLFRTIVLDVWKARKEDITVLRAAAERKMTDLKRRKDQLVEAFIFQRVIDEATYKDQLGKLNEAMAPAEIDQHDHRSDELDIEALLDFTEKVSLDAPRLWLEANLDQRQRFQSFLFPEGLKVAEGAIRNPVTA